MASPILESLESIFAGQDLNTDAADAAMTQIMGGEATDAQIGAFLAALRMKGESVAEITGCAQAMKRVAVQVRPKLNGQRLLDTCGTGGDQTGTFNISTTVAFVVAGAGEKVAKHGNRSASSQCGSADVLEEMGVQLDLGPEQVAECIEAVGIGFLFAPLYHPAMKYAIGPRRELATRTVFNFLGPLTNPANATHQVIGVPSPNLTSQIAEVLGQMGSTAAFVVHGTTDDGRGVDELTTAGVNRISHLRHGEVRESELSATDLGLSPASLDDLAGGDAPTNAAITRGILSGELRGPKRDVVLLNAAAALATESSDWEAGLSAAAQSIDSGAAQNSLNAFIEKTQSFSGSQ
ncbi:MAG: anthranilate phosphoribosyltransferase [Caldilineaceae bacterium]|nr:anthranilate phosphoribosyltransferase [Caldilineaceae bacterium]